MESRTYLPISLNKWLKSFWLVYFQKQKLDRKWVKRNENVVKSYDDGHFRWLEDEEVWLQAEMSHRQ